MKMGSKILLVLMPGLAGAVAIMSVMTLAKSNIKAAPDPTNEEAPDIALKYVPPAVGPGCRHADRIIAAGLVEPVGGVIRIGAHSRGIVSRVLVKPGNIVSKSDPLLMLDTRAAQATLEIRKSDVTIARARLASRLAEAIEAQHNIDIAKATLEEKRAEFADALQLSGMATRLQSSSNISKREALRRHYLLKQARAKVSQATAALDKARSRLIALSSQKGGHLIEMERANIARAKAQVEAAHTAIELLTVAAPSSGTIYQVNVRPGEHTGVDGDPLILMGGHAKLSVKVDVYEADISRFDTGMTAVASRRGSQSERHSLSLVHLFPMVVPKKTLNGRPDEQEDTRIFQVLYRLKGAPFLPGEVIDVFIGPPCAAAPNANIHGTSAKPG